MWFAITQIANVLIYEEYIRAKSRKLKEGYIFEQYTSKPKLKPSKCPCCGARDWKEHEGAMICTYCRSEQ